MRAIHLLSRASALTAAVLFAAACGEDSLTGVDPSVFGTYTLVSIAGESLPYTFDFGSVVTGGHVELKSNGDLDGRIEGRDADGADETDDLDGSFQISGTAITLMIDSEEPATGTLVNGTLTVPDEDQGDWVFRK